MLSRSELSNVVSTVTLPRWSSTSGKDPKESNGIFTTYFAGFDRKRSRSLRLMENFDLEATISRGVVSEPDWHGSQLYLC